MITNIIKEEFYQDDNVSILAKVSSTSEFIEVVNRLQGDNEGELIYRGQGSKDWSITSSLTRTILPSLHQIKKELNIKEELNDKKLKESQRFRDYLNSDEIRSFIKNKKNKILSSYSKFKNQLPIYMNEIDSKEYLMNSDLSLLMLAQHYGLPTRFIDWSYNPLVSLYFSVDSSDCDSAAVFVCLPKTIITGESFSKAFDMFYNGDNSRENEYKNLTSMAMNEIEKFKHLAFEDNSSRNDIKRKDKLIEDANKHVNKIRPIIFDPHDSIFISHYLFDKRMSSQECVFYYQDNIYEKFNARDGDILWKIEIDNPTKIKNELINLGVVESKIYPSISGLVKTLKYALI